MGRPASSASPFSVAIERSSAGGGIYVVAGDLHGVSEERFQNIAEELGVTRAALKSFFKILDQHQVDPEDLDSTLRVIAARYKNLQARLASFTADDSLTAKLREEAEEALKIPDFDLAEKKLNEVSERDIQVAKELHAVTNQRLLSAAAARAANGDLKLTQLAYKDALEYYRQAAELLPVGEELARAEYLSRQGQISAELGLYEQAAAPFERALQIQEAIYGTDDPRTVIALTYTAFINNKLGRHDIAELSFQRAAALFEREGASGLANLARTLNSMASAIDAQGRRAEAERLTRRALGMGVRALGRRHPDVGVWANNLANFYSRSGRFAAALRLYRYAIRIDEQVLGAKHPATAKHYSNIGSLLLRVRRLQEAAYYLNKAVESGEMILGFENGKVIERALLLAVVLIETEKYEDAEKLSRRTLAICERRFGENHVQTALALNALGKIYLETGRYDEAEKLLDRALEAGSRVLKQSDHSQQEIFAFFIYNKAKLLLSIGQCHNAENLFQRSIEIIEETDRIDSRCFRIFRNYAELCKKQRRDREAFCLYKRAIDILRPHADFYHAELLFLLEQQLILLQTCRQLGEACKIEEFIAQLQGRRPPSVDSRRDS